MEPCAADAEKPAARPVIGHSGAVEVRDQDADKSQRIGQRPRETVAQKQNQNGPDQEATGKQVQAGDAPILREQTQGHGKEQETQNSFGVFDLMGVFKKQPKADQARASVNEDVYSEGRDRRAR